MPDPGRSIVARFRDLIEGEGKLVQYHGEDIALFKIGSEVHAVENTCPHQGASLAEGWLEGDHVSCPWHAWCFSLKSGQMSMGDYASIQVYAVEIEDGNVVITGPKRDQ